VARFFKRTSKLLNCRKSLLTPDVLVIVERGRPDALDFQALRPKTMIPPRSTLRKLASGSLRLVLGAGCAMANVLEAADANEFKVFTYDFRNDGPTLGFNDLPGRLYVPPIHDPAHANYDPNATPSPIVIFFHGFGEKGTNNTSQVNGNINNLFARAKTHPFFLYAPQTSQDWDSTKIEIVMQMAAKIAIDYRADTSRMYVTGLSMGGNGVYTSASEYRAALAAALPICPGSGFNVSPANLVGMPIWIFHARNDLSTNATFQHSRDRVNEIREAEGKPPLSYPLNSGTSNPYYNDGAPYFPSGTTYYNENELRHTEFATGGHSIWGPVYNQTTPSFSSYTYPLYQWLFSHTQTPEPPKPGEVILYDLGGAPGTVQDSANRTWNRTVSGTEKTPLPFLAFSKTATGRRTSVVPVSSGIYSSPTLDGLTEGVPYDLTISQDGWVSLINSTETANTAVITFRGLSPGGKYAFRIWASHKNNDGGRGRMSRYKANGIIDDLQVYNNLTEFAELPGVEADANGIIELKIYPTPGSGSRYGQANVIELRAEGSALDAWRGLHALAPDGSEDMLSPASDGIPNLVKFALNMARHPGDLSKPAYVMPPDGTAGLPLIQSGEEGTFNFVKRSGEPAATGIEYQVQVSEDLETWDPITADPEIITIDADWERVQYPLDTHEHAEFYRLQILTP
jgi:predicted peptidase